MKNIKLTDKQRRDLETVMYFIPLKFRIIKVTQEEIYKFFEYSDQGKHKEDINERFVSNGFNCLTQGKRWRGIHMQMYEDGVLDGSMPYFTLLGGCTKILKRKWYQFWKARVSIVNDPIPRSVVDFMKKEMFKGKDADLIERVYQSILSH